MKLTDVKAQIAQLETDAAVLFADRASLMQQAADLQVLAGQKFVTQQEKLAELATLKSQLFDGFAAALTAAPGAATYADVGAAMDAVS